MNYQFSGPGGSDSLAWDLYEGIDDINFSEVAALKSSTGWVNDALHPWLAEGILEMSFDEKANVTDWYFQRWEGGPSTDWVSRTHGDSGGAINDEGLGFYSIGPGTWTKSVEPSPVPLPASAALLIAGVAALAGFGAKSRRRSSHEALVQQKSSN